MKVRPGGPSSGPASEETSEAPKASRKASTRSSQSLFERAPADDSSQAQDGIEAHAPKAGGLWREHAPPMPKVAVRLGPVTARWNGASTQPGPLGAKADRVNVNVGANLQTQGGASGGFIVGHDVVEASVSQTWSSVPGAPSLTGAVAGWSHDVELGVGLTVNTPGNSGSVSANAFLSLDRELTLQGEYDGDDPRLAGTHVVQLERQVGVTGVLSFAKLAKTLGIGGGLSPSRTSSLRLVTHLAPDEAAAAVLERGGAAGYLKNKARAAGVVAERFAVPNLAHPETLRLGDELTVSTDGAITGGVALGALALSFGAQVVLHGTFELSATKLDDDKIALTVTPSDVRAVQASVNLPLMGDAGASRATATALSQSFVFDLSQPKAKAAYLAALEGTLPGAVLADEDVDAVTLAQRLRGETLPPGVTRSFAERSKGLERTVGAGIRFAFMQEGTALGALGSYWTRASGTRELTDGQVIARLDTRDVSRRREVLISGSETAGVRATKRSVTTFDAKGKPHTAFDGLRLTARYSDTKARGLELNRDVISPLNGLFDLRIEPIEKKRKNQQWEVAVSRELDATALAALGRPQDLTAVEQRVQVPRKAMEKLSEHLRAEKNPMAQADLVLDFVHKHGINGFAAVSAMLGGAATALELSRVTDAYQSVVRDAEKLALEFPQPFALSEGIERLRQRYDRGNALLDEVTEAEAFLTDDPFAQDAERAAIATQLERARATASEALSVTQLTPQERLAVSDALGMGWVSERDQQVRRYLESVGFP